MISVPKHIAVTMDGNGRWGQQRGLTRSEGHYAGAQTMEKMIDDCIELGVEIVTLYAFSSENWSRPENEVNYLMFLPVRFFRQKLPVFMKKNIKILVSGDLDNVPERTRRVMMDAIRKTENNTGIIVNFAFNYGGRDDILQAAQKLIEAVQVSEFDIDQIDESLFAHFLYTGDLPDPDLCIRTGGEQRVSNFLLWQSATAQLYFTDVYFPDFNKEVLMDAIHEYNKNKTGSFYDHYENTSVVDGNRTAMP